MGLYAVMYADTLEDTNGKPLANLAYQVFLRGTTVPATIYSDRNKTAFTGSLVSNQYGQFEFWVDPGYYDIKAEFTQSLEYIGEDAADTIGPGDVAERPDNGWLKEDLEQSVQESLDKANTALQVAPVTSVNGYTGDVQIDGDGTTVGDATDTTKGIIALAGDLAGPASAPTVPGLADKVTAAELAETVQNAIGGISVPTPPAAGNPVQYATRRDIGRFIGDQDPRLKDPRLPRQRSVAPEHLTLDLAGSLKKGFDFGLRSFSDEPGMRRASLATRRESINLALRAQGFDPYSRAESSMVSRSQIANDLPVVNGEMLVINLSLTESIPVSQFYYAVGKTSAAVGATLVRLGLYEIGLNGGLTKLAESANVASTALQTLGGMENAKFRTNTGYPRSLVLSSEARYAWAFLAVGQSTPGFLRGVDLNGTAAFIPVGGYSISGQTDLPASVPGSRYSSSKTYALNDLVLQNDVIYKSLQAANLNHSPATNNTWWAPLGTKAPTNKLAWGATTK